MVWFSSRKKLRMDNGVSEGYLFKAVEILGGEKWHLLKTHCINLETKERIK